MPLEFYKVLHLFAIFCVLTPLSAMCFHMMNGGTRQFPHRKWLGMMHGVGALLVLISGFGMLAKLGLMASFPGWAFAKIAIWLALGGLPVLIYRQPKAAKAFWILILLLATVAAWIGVNHNSF